MATRKLKITCSLHSFLLDTTNLDFKTLPYPIIFIPIEKSLFYMFKWGNKMFRFQGQDVKYHKTWVISISGTLTKLKKFPGYLSKLKKFSWFPRRWNNQVSIIRTRQKMNSSQVKLVSLGQFHWFHIWCCSDGRRHIILAWGAFLWGLHLISSVWTNTSSFWTYPGQDEMPGCCGKHTDWNHPPWSGTIVTSCMSCFMTGGPGKEHWTKKSPATGRVQERSKGDTTCPTTSQNPSRCIHLGWTRRAPPGRTLSQNDWQPRNESRHHKTKTATHVAEQFSWVPLSPALHPGVPSQWNLLLFQHVSPQTIHFWVLDKSPVSGPGRGPPTATRLFPFIQAPQSYHIPHLTCPNLSSKPASL